MRAPLVLTLLLLGACNESPPSPDAGVEDAGESEDASKPVEDTGVPDGGPEDLGPSDLGTGPTLTRGQNPSALELAESEGRRLRGRVGALGTQTASTPSHRLRGGFGPLAP